MPSADLSDASLAEADLSGADLNGANLQRANLMNAVLKGTNLRNADLSNTTLIGAEFTNADLRGANLSGAQLGERGKVIFLGDLDTRLSPTQFKGARFDEKTLLPFDCKEGKSRGMILVQEKNGKQLVLRPIEVDFGEKPEKRSSLNK